MNGLYRAFVTDSRDPSNLGRIKVSIPAVTGATATEWIYPVVAAGYVVTPRAGEQVWVLFEAGDVENPVWIGKSRVTDTGVNKTTVGYSTLIQRVEQLEAEVVSIKSRLSAGNL